jgi:hypothetical protein
LGGIGYLDKVPYATATRKHENRFMDELKVTGETMPKEGESPSVGWRAVYNEMGVSTVAEPTVLDVSEMGTIRQRHTGTRRRGAEK